MNKPLDTEFLEAWNLFLQEVELAKSYHMPYVLIGLGNTWRNPLLDLLLPSLLSVKLVALLDQGLAEFITQQHSPMPKKYQGTLNGRIEFLNDQGKLKHFQSLHQIRLNRNRLAHEVSTQSTWETLSAEINIVEGELQNLGLVGERPIYSFFGERSELQSSNKPGVAFSQEFRFGIKCDETVVMEIRTRRDTYNAAS